MKKMSKILSIILAISMVISMIPVTFAAEGEADYAGVTVVYPLWQGAYGGALKPYEITYTNPYSAGRMQWHSDTSSYTHNPGWGKGTIELHLKAGEYAAWTIKVPASGLYDISMTYGVSARNTKGKMYLVPGVSKNVMSEISEENYVMTVDFKTGNGQSETVWADFNNFYNNNNDGSLPTTGKVTKELTAGEYTVVWVGTGDTSSTLAGRYILRPATMTLDGNGTDKSLIYADLTGTKTELDAASGEEANIVLNAVYMSDGKTATDTEKQAITYSSSANSIATITTDNKIKAVSEGNATIYAKNGEYVLGQIDISVKDTEKSGVTVVYPISSQIAYSTGVSSPADIKYTSEKSAGRMEWHLSNQKFTASFVSYALGLYTMSDEEYASFKIRVPKAGKYTVRQKFAYRSLGTASNMYILDAKTTDIALAIKSATPVLTVNSYSSATVDTSAEELRSENAPVVTAEWTAPAAGEYIVAWQGTGEYRNSNGRWYVAIGDLILDGNGTETPLIFSDISLGETAFEINGTTTITKGKSYLSNGTEAIDLTGVTYKSTNENVATISDTLVTAVGAGNAKIQVVRADGYVLDEVDVTVTASMVIPEEKEITDTTVNFQAGAYGGGSVSNDNIQEVTIGSDVTVTATANDGYTFAYWKNSAGVVLSTNATETFKVSTNMGVIAVFDAETIDTAIPVQFYNGNGMLLGSASVAKDTTFGAAKSAAGITTTPTLTGYVFSHWSDKDANVAIEDNDLITALTRAVAQYKDDAKKPYTVKNGETTVASNVKYGESVTVNGSTNFTAWKLGDKVVSYEKDYTFDVYGNITLTEVTGETMAKAPVLVLDKVDGNYFLTYDEGDYELIEAGILFGSENVSIESIDGYKAAAKRHTGQFTAQPHEGATSSTIARGYMICKYNDEFKVIYAD